MKLLGTAGDMPASPMVGTRHRAASMPVPTASTVTDTLVALEVTARPPLPFIQDMKSSRRRFKDTAALFK